VALGALVGAARALQSATEGLAAGSLAGAAALLHAGSAGQVAERRLRERPGLRQELLDQLSGATGQAASTVS